MTGSIFRRKSPGSSDQFPKLDSGPDGDARQSSEAATVPQLASMAAHGDVLARLCDAKLRRRRDFIQRLRRVVLKDPRDLLTEVDS